MTTETRAFRTSREWYDLTKRARAEYRELKLHKRGERDEDILRGLIGSIYLYDAGERTDALFAKLERLLNGTRAAGT